MQTPPQVSAEREQQSANTQPMQQQLLRGSWHPTDDELEVQPVRNSESTFINVAPSFGRATSGKHVGTCYSLLPNLLKVLSTGQLIKDDGFSLFDAVSALEVCYWSYLLLNFHIY